MKTKLLAVVVILLRVFSLIPGTVFARPALAQGAVHDGPCGQTDPHTNGDWISNTDVSLSGIPLQNLDYWTLFLIGLNHKRAINRMY